MKKILILVIALATMAFTATYTNAKRSYKGNMFHPEGYGYAPATVFYDGVFHQFFCSQGFGSDSMFYHPDYNIYFRVPKSKNEYKYTQGFWDFIRYRTSKNGETYTPARVALTPTAGPTRGSQAGTETCACDPAIIKHGDYWYLYYTGAVEGFETMVFVARSKSLNGPFKRYGQQNGVTGWYHWPTTPFPILAPRENVRIGAYGLGQLSVVKKDNKFHFWFQYTLNGKPEQIMHVVSSDPYSGLQAATWTPIKIDGKNQFEVNDFGEVRWNDATGRFELWMTSEWFQKAGVRSNYIIKYESKDGNTWTKTADKIGPYNFMHNVGVSGDENGHVNGRYIVTFAAPSNGLGTSDAVAAANPPWNMYQVMIGGTQKSTIPSVSSSGYQFPVSSRNLEAIHGDFDGDGITDLGVVNRDSSKWYVISSMTGKKGTESVRWGFKWKDISSNHKILSADYDGDGKDDIAIVDVANGSWSIRSSRTKNALITANGTRIYNWKYSNMNSSSIPLTGDYDGDGKADIGFVNPSSGKWYIKSSATGSNFADGWPWPGMTSAFIPVEGDYDGDGRTNRAIYNKSNGNWYIYSSQRDTANVLKDLTTLILHTSATAFTDFWGRPWGGTGYTPAIGDFDGDGKDDRTLVSLSSHIWIHMDWYDRARNVPISDMGSNSQFFVGDYDGDGISDEAIFNKSTRKFHIHSSRSKSMGVSATPIEHLYPFSSSQFLAKVAGNEQYGDMPKVVVPTDLKIHSEGLSVNVSGLKLG
ncbi:MAG: VCBS repeat-containing protein, partial [Fibrobacter sp.]|nr:VCBS repeat-containing protein [Fibrobacter sp.]